MCEPVTLAPVIGLVCQKCDSQLVLCCVCLSFECKCRFVAPSFVIYSKQAIYKLLKLNPPDYSQIEKRLIQSVQGRQTFKQKYFDEMTLDLLLHLKQLRREPNDYEQMIDISFSASDINCLERLQPEMSRRLFSNPFVGVYHLINDERVQGLMGYLEFKERAIATLEQINSKLSEQDQKFFEMYGRLPPKHLKDRKFFDSGDYALNKAGKSIQVGSKIPSPESIAHKAHKESKLNE